MKADLGADSLDEVNIVQNLEDEFGIEISEEAATAAVTVGDIISLIEGMTE